MKRNILSVAAVILAISASAFTTVRSNTLYKFNGDSSNMHDADQYQVISTPPAVCGGTALPCYVSTDQDLQTWLDARSDSQIVSDASARKN